MILNNVSRGHALRMALGLITIALFLASSASAVDVNACTTISMPEEYVLQMTCQVLQHALKFYQTMLFLMAADTLLLEGGLIIISIMEFMSPQE